MEWLQQKIDTLYQDTTILSLDNYNNLLHNCVLHKEMEATVFVYDHMLKKKVKPNDNTYKIIEKLHSKTIPESEGGVFWKEQFHDARKGGN